MGANLTLLWVNLREKFSPPTQEVSLGLCFTSCVIQEKGKLFHGYSWDVLTWLHSSGQSFLLFICSDYHYHYTCSELPQSVTEFPPSWWELVFRKLSLQTGTLEITKILQPCTWLQRECWEEQAIRFCPRCLKTKLISNSRSTSARPAEATFFNYLLGNLLEKSGGFKARRH